MLPGCKHLASWRTRTDMRCARPLSWGIWTVQGVDTPVQATEDDRGIDPSFLDNCGFIRQSVPTSVLNSASPLVMLVDG